MAKVAIEQDLLNAFCKLCEFAQAEREELGNYRTATDQDNKQRFLYKTHEYERLKNKMLDKVAELMLREQNQLKST